MYFFAELNKKNPLRVGFSPAASYSPLQVMNTDGPDEGGRLWHLVRNVFHCLVSFVVLAVVHLIIELFLSAFIPGWHIPHFTPFGYKIQF